MGKDQMPNFKTRVWKIYFPLILITAGLRICVISKGPLHCNCNFLEFPVSGKRAYTLSPGCKSLMDFV